MRIVLAYNMLDQISGETAFFDNMVQSLQGKGHDVIPCPVPCYPVLAPLGIFEQYSRFPMLRNARRLLEKHQDADIVHYLNSVLAPAGKGLKFGASIATSHFFAESHLALSPPQNQLARLAERVYCGYISWLDRPAMNSLDCLVASGYFEARQIISSYGLEAAKVKVIAPGIDVQYLDRLERIDLKAEYSCEETVVYLGRLNERSKGVSYLIRALKAIERDGLKLLIVGDGPDRRNYERLVEKEGLRGKVEFLGQLGFDKKSIVQKSADVVAMPSLSEVFGTVFAECLACGTPVVAFDMPFWKGLYDGAGVFAKPRDSASLAASICEVLDDESLRARLISRGRKLSERYDIRNTVDAYLGLYEELA